MPVQQIANVGSQGQHLYLAEALHDGAEIDFIRRRGNGHQARPRLQVRHPHCHGPSFRPQPRGSPCTQPKAKAREAMLAQLAGGYNGCPVPPHLSKAKLPNSFAKCNLKTCPRCRHGCEAKKVIIHPGWFFDPQHNRFPSWWEKHSPQGAYQRFPLASQAYQGVAPSMRLRKTRADAVVRGSACLAESSVQANF